MKNKPYKIPLNKLSSTQKDDLIQHLDSLAHARVAANNELIKRLAPMPEPIALIFNQWSKVCNELELGSEKEIKRICGEPEARPERSILQ